MTFWKRETVGEKKDQWLPGSGGQVRDELMKKKYDGTFGTGRNALYFDFCCCYSAVCFFQNS